MYASFEKMTSPVSIPFNSFIQLDPKDANPLYLQLVFEFIKAIQAGDLPEGTKLPGTRVLCKLFGVNRNTLVKAFDDLAAQGFIDQIPNRGTFILAGHAKHRARGRMLGEENKQSAVSSFTFSMSAVLEDPLEVSDLPYQFNDGMPDLRLLHTDVLARLYVSKLKRKRNSLSWQQLQSKAHETFKMQFANYLNLTRGLRISPSRLLTTSNHAIGLYLVIKALIAVGDKVIVTNPGYYLPNMTLSDSNARVLTVPVDAEGLSVVHLEQLCETQKIRMVYLTSNYHYPTTVVLSAKRRIAILDLAARYDFIIVEDDYDYDFHHDTNPILPLAAFDTNERVVYISSFARSLPMGFGYGFVTGPAAFMRELQKHQGVLEPGIDVIKEQVLAEWIEEGEVHRLFKKNKKIYRERRDAFVALLERELGGYVRFQVPLRGLAIWVEWLDSFNLMHLQKACALRGLFLPTTILYQTKDMTATRLGFGHLEISEMEEMVARLKEGLRAVKGE